MATSNVSSERRAFAMKAYELTQNKIESLDSASFRIKNWAVVTWIAIVGIAIREDSAIYMTVSLFPTIMFWSLDVCYKFFQEQFVDLSSDTAQILLKDVVTPTDLQRCFPSSKLTTQFFSNGRPTLFLARALKRQWHHALYIALTVITVLLSLTLGILHLLE